MISSLLSPDIQSFIEEHQHDDPNEIFLKYQSILGLPTSVVVDQITGRKKTKEKLPTWFKGKQILFPPAINIEQASSERAAEIKIEKIREELGSTFASRQLLDLTGGFGVDSYFFSRVFDRITLVEPNPQLLEIVKHNFQILNVTNVDYHNATAEEFLASLAEEHTYDLIYIDPSRRSKDNRKVFSFSQCEPDVIKLLPKLFQISSRMMVKSSPLLDITLGLRELREVEKVIITSINNECKELLFFCHQGIKREPMIEAINLSSSKSTFSFFPSDESISEVQYSDPLIFLYEPYASVLKSGAFKLISSKFKCHKLQPNTHIYTSEQLVKTFPGRIFQIESFVKPDSKTLKNFFSEGKGNIMVRNYPLTANELRKKTGLREGGEKFLIGFSGVNSKFLTVASRVK